MGQSKMKMPATADNRVLEVDTQRLRPSQALEPLYEMPDPAHLQKIYVWKVI